jgi:hypothetical protein
MSEAANPAGRLRAAVEAVKEGAERAARVRRDIAAELEPALQRMELGAPEARRVETALAAQLTRVAETLSHPPRRWVRVGESRVLAAAEAVSVEVSGLATAQVGVSAAAGEQLRKRQELRRSFRRLPDAGRAAERSRRHLARAFQPRAVAAVAGRLTSSGRVLARLRTGSAVLEELAAQLRGLLPPLDHARAELGFFTCRGRAVAVPAARGRRREEVELAVDPNGELMFVWDRYGGPRLTVYPARETAWRDGKTRWRPCFSLPRDNGDGRRLRIERAALATWTSEGHARLVRAGVLAWEQRTHAASPTGAHTSSQREEG